MTFTKKFYVFQEDIGFVIGAKGATINNIKKTSHANVQIYKPVSMGGCGEGPKPYFLIQAQTQESLDYAWFQLESIAQESYNRRHGIFHDSCPPEKRFVPMPKPQPETYDISKKQVDDFKYKVSPCMCVINLPPNTLGEHIEKKILSEYIGHVCNRCHKTFTHATHVSKEHPITPMNYTPPPLLQEPIILHFSDDEDDTDEELEDFKIEKFKVQSKDDTYSGNIELKQLLIEDGNAYGITLIIEGKERKAIFVK